MLKRIGAVIASAFLILGLAAAPAQADDPLWNETCGEDNICFYQTLTTGYEMWVLAIGMPVSPESPERCVNFYDEEPELNLEDTITAWVNNWSYDPRVDLKFYVDRDCDDWSGASSWTNQSNGEFWGGVATLGISSVEIRYHQ